MQLNTTFKASADTNGGGDNAPRSKYKCERLVACNEGFAVEILDVEKGGDKSGREFLRVIYRIEDQAQDDQENSVLYSGDLVSENFYILSPENCSEGLKKMSAIKFGDLLYALGLSECSDTRQLRGKRCILRTKRDRQKPEYCNIVTHAKFETRPKELAESDVPF